MSRPRRSGAGSQVDTFAATVVDWQRREGRHGLPWQNTRDPYRIWLSEVMLQQTQVGTVIPYYQRFLAAFSDVRALAAAPLDEVMRLWSGLGYYSRARNLHRCAIDVVELHGGVFPADPATLATLPGIGRSTAAAIAVFAHGERAAILDGNVRRVLCRVFGIEGWPGERQVEARLWDLAERELPAAGIEAPGIEVYTQGLMDLGATVCTRHRPACERCPAAPRCVARREGSVARLPAPRPSRSLPERACRMYLIGRGGDWLIEKRPPSGIWGGLWSLPQQMLADDGQVNHGQVNDGQAGDGRAAALDEAWTATPAGVRARAPAGECHGLRFTGRRALEPFVHTFTHFRLRIEPWLCEVETLVGASAAGTAWLPAHEVAAAALPQPVKRLLLALGAPGAELRGFAPALRAPGAAEDIAGAPTGG